ncbi:MULTISPECIES: hypothetical protein [unclassified Mesorhizobium]|uniref:hypothetical protein n=1 Tax=unclassified Mesorhizobium TaxID=325217 RepID=UPI000F75C615|nr:MULTISPECIES: hypothetical protein [unclassified Mesorhizobium]AZO28656.1 hypothetical protein EJ071_15570 [Mesorhizobium sp. M1B.F.Ca.ET.045.04.1.1]RWB17887.1 MAG: hypothetical protein EOQ40_24670 [Mesorhizobium sp.]
MAHRDVRRLLEGSGYSQISLDRIDADIFVGHDLDQAIEFQLALGPAGEVYREAGDEAVEVARANTEALKAELAPCSTSDSVGCSGSRQVTARRDR